MSYGAAIALAFIGGAFFMILLRLFVYGMALLMVKKGERLQHKGEELAATAEQLRIDLENIERKLNNG